MNEFLYSQYKRYVLENMYEYLAEGGDTTLLREYINYRCFDSLQYRDETIDELYAANYFMWFKLYTIHEFPIGDGAIKELKKITAYLETGKETLPCPEKEAIEEDIAELKQIEKHVTKAVKLDFTEERHKMNGKLFINGEPEYRRYGKTNNSADWKTAKEILSNAGPDYTEKFLCLDAYFRICMYNEVRPETQIAEQLSDFLCQAPYEKIIRSFTTADEQNVKDHVGFLKRSKDFRHETGKDAFLDILEEKNIGYDAGNYVDRIEIGDIIIAMNTTCANDIIIPRWHIKIAENKIYYTVAQFDNRRDAYMYFLENFTQNTGSGV